MTELTKSFPSTQEEIWAELLNWLNNNKELDAKIREDLLNRLSKIRIKMQLIFAEIQRATITNLALDIEFEGALKEALRDNFIYMTPKEQVGTLNSVAKTNELKLLRLERQLAGFDLFSNIEFNLQTEDTSKAPTVLLDKVKQMSPNKRRNLLNIIDEIKTEIHKTDLENPTNDDEE